ncbi:polysaccharide deacetylase family protein [Shivajiella indica]|uniref:Polysaccharide deacetylase family protein n=1 Tax=Shivajiella indica TaxID=872115 RepID=A0ABW5B7S8_9BACT
MKKSFQSIILAGWLAFAFMPSLWGQTPAFPWPEGKKMALSLSFDDARKSNVDLGIPLLDQYGIKATFFVLPAAVESNLTAWKKAIAVGHEIGNHTMIHPCSGNFIWARERALENYTMDRMQKELIRANEEIQSLLGITPMVFAYPCGQTFIGKGVHTQSLVPLVSEMFLAGRGWMGEAPSDPHYADLAQLTGMEMDGKSFQEILPLIESASKNGQWLVLAGHDTQDSGNQSTYLSFLRDLSEYVNDPDNGIWVAPIGTIAQYVNETRMAIADTTNIPELVRADLGNQLILTAEKGRGIGPDIKYMPDWKAFGWFTSKDKVVWDVAIPSDGEYEAWLEWSVSDEEAGKEFLFQAGNESIRGTVEKSGSWETFKKKSIGKMTLRAGYVQMEFKPAVEFEEEALLDLKEIILKKVD